MLEYQRHGLPRRVAPRSDEMNRAIRNDDQNGHDSWKTQSAEGSRTDGDLVLDRAHAIDAARNAFGRVLLGHALGKAGEHHGAVECLDLDGAGVDELVLDHAALDLGGDGGVIDVGADRLLAALDGATGGGEHGDGGHGGGEGDANVHGETPVDKATGARMQGDGDRPHHRWAKSSFLKHSTAACTLGTCRAGVRALAHATELIVMPDLIRRRNANAACAVVRLFGCQSQPERLLTNGSSRTNR